MKKLGQKGKRLFWLLCALLLAAGLLCFMRAAALGRSLEAQQMAERWQGEGETRYAQVSCYLPLDGGLTLDQIYRFRMTVQDQLHQASLDQDTGQTLFIDAWSTSGKLGAVSEHGHGEASVIAVGGEYFRFHPLRLLSGSYLSEQDLMKDRVLLDEELAWLLFGGTELSGMQIKLNGVPFVVAGVVEREQDRASRLAYSAGMGLYMSFEAFSSISEDARISCYELCLAEPVDGFTLNFMREKFPIGQGEIVRNSGRFSVGRLAAVLRQWGTRSMQKQGMIYPYWENAARSVEDRCAMLLLIGSLLLLVPLVRIAIQLFLLGKRIWLRFRENLLPKLSGRISESVRRAQRRRWKRLHPDDAD